MGVEGLVVVATPPFLPMRCLWIWGITPATENQRQTSPIFQVSVFQSIAKENQTYLRRQW